MDSFHPIPAVTIQPWTSSLKDGVEPGTIVLDPHHAFGTGRHPSTRLCLEIMEMLFRAGPDFEEVLDFVEPEAKAHGISVHRKMDYRIPISKRSWISDAGPASLPFRQY